MEVVRTNRELQARADALRAAGRRIALVPTMGALHEGHLSLVAEGRARADEVWVSIFVNPTQFNETADLDAYPRTWESDIEACERVGVDLVFAPTAGEMYPDGADTTVQARALARPLCGSARPGHFDGVTTIVSKLFLAAKPHVAVFGEKDFQQLAVIRRMVRDLNFDVEIVGGATVREPDGLALSSRNLRLDAEARAQAVVLFRSLQAADDAVQAGERDAEAILALVRREIEKAPRAVIDYAELRDPESLEPAPAVLEGPTLLALAVFLTTPDGDMDDAVRLIDNRVLRAPCSEVDPR
jgi:pantoate--beta-alanine ligase